MYKHVYGDFKKDEKEKASTGTPFVRSWWQTLRSAIQQLCRSSCFTAKRGDLWGISTHGITFPLSFLEVMTAEKHILWPLQTLLCVLQRSLPPFYCCSRSMKQYTCMLKIVTRLPWECLQIFILLRGCCTLLPFPSTFTSLCTPGSSHAPGKPNCLGLHEGLIKTSDNQNKLNKEFAHTNTRCDSYAAGLLASWCWGSWQLHRRYIILHSVLYLELVASQLAPA